MKVCPETRFRFFLLDHIEINSTKLYTNITQVDGLCSIIVDSFFDMELNKYIFM
jgi:hypothetical protein